MTANEKAKIALRKHILANKDKVTKDLNEMRKKYLEKKVRKMEEQNEFNEQFSGCLALVFLVVVMIVIGCL